MIRRERCELLNPEFILVDTPQLRYLVGLKHVGSETDITDSIRRSHDYIYMEIPYIKNYKLHSTKCSDNRKVKRIFEK